MADNSPQNGTDTIATDDLATLNGGATSGVKVQRSKVGYGDDGIFRDVSTTYPLPAVTPNSYTTGTISAANANQYIGTATANSSVVVTIPDGHSSWDVYINGTFSAGTTLQFQGSLDGTNWFSLNGRRNTDASTNDTTNFIATDFVGGPSPTGANPSNFRGVIGGIRYFRVTCVVYTASDSISVQISTSAGVGPTFLNNVPQFSLLDSSASGSLTAVGSVMVPSTGTGTVGVQVTGTFVASFVFEASNDGTNFFTVNGVVSGTGAQVSGASAPGQWRVNASGYAYTRVRVSAYTSGTVVIKLNGSSASGLTTLAEPLPAGTNSIGSVTVTSAPTTAVTGTFWQATQPVSLATNTPTLAAGTNQIGTVGEHRAATLVQTATGAAAAATATLPAAGAGLFHYITNIRLERFMTAAGTASGTRVAATTTNLNSLAFTLPADAATQGTQSVPVDFRPVTPLRSAVANTATTVVSPSVAGTTYLIIVTYFTGS